MRSGIERLDAYPEKIGFGEAFRRLERYWQSVLEPDAVPRDILAYLARLLERREHRDGCEKKRVPCARETLVDIKNW